MDDIYDNDPTDLAIIRYHTWWPGGNDPYYRANVDENNNRINYYSVNYTPDAWFDGDIHGGSGYGSWGTYISNEQGVSSPLAIDLLANYGQTGDFGTITAIINAIDPITETNLKVRFAITESNLPPYGNFEVFNHVMRDMVPDAAGLDLTISQGEVVNKEVTFTLSNEWNISELTIIAFVQSDNSHQILQVAKLVPPTGILRGRVLNQLNGFGVPDANLSVVNTSLGASTDFSGEYDLAFLAGSWSVIVEAPGFNPDTVDVVIMADDTTSLDISLEPQATGSISGTILDPSSMTPLGGEVTLHQNGNPLATVDADPVTGEYAFDGIVVSSPSVVYTDISVDLPIPYGVAMHGDTVVVAEGTPVVVDFDVTAADVFLVDDDEGEGYENYFRDEILAAGRRYFHYDVSEMGESATNYVQLFPLTSSIVWFTGDATANTITPAEQDSLAAFLDRGGKLFLTGQNIVEDLDDTGSTFLQSHLHVSHGGSSANIWSRDLAGNPVTYDPDVYLTSGNGGANNQDSRDVLVAVAPAVEFCQYVLSPSDPASQGTAAIYIDSQNGSKVVLMGFGFESINHLGGGEDRATREETMLAILNWFDGITGIGDDRDSGGDVSIPRALTLQQNYPNPFNPSTTIRYSIPSLERIGNGSGATVPVRLTLYDLRGRRIRTLVDQEQAPGHYAVHWDGRDEANRSVGSGLFLYRLEVDDQVLTRKMTLLK